jgi:hypothetical protein
MKKESPGWDERRQLVTISPLPSFSGLLKSQPDIDLALKRWAIVADFEACFF